MEPNTNTHASALILMMCCGLRLREIAALRADDVDFSGDSVILHVRQPKTSQKTGSTARCFAPPAVAAVRALFARHRTATWCRPHRGCRPGNAWRR